MKLSMWILARWLEEYQPQLDIQDGTANISGVRFMENELTEFPRDHVYIGWASEAFSDPDYSERAMLVHGYDFIFVNGVSIETLINKVLAALDYYNSWESRLWEASVWENALAKMIEFSDDVFDHPSRIMDMNGRVLAISRKFGPDDVDARWKKIYETGMVQLANIGTSVITAEGEWLAEWEEIPRRYYTEDHEINYIAANVVVDGETVAAFLMEENGNGFTRAHCQIAGVFCSVLKSALKEKKNNTMLRSRASVLLDLLEGKKPEDGFSQRLDFGGRTGTLELLVIRSIRENTPTIRKGSMLTLIRQIEVSNISLTYKEDIVCVVAGNKTEAFLEGVMEVINPRYYMIGTALPFEGWEDIPLRYGQACFAIDMGKKIPGVYRCEDFAFEHLVSSVVDANYAMELCHPALFRLKNYDKEQNTEFYQTLYYYLANERSMVKTAKAMGIHRNTLSYRIGRICELIKSNLEDPDERAFIYLSYKMNEKNF